MRDWLGKNAVIPIVQNADTVGANQRRTVLLARLQDAFFHLASLRCFLSEACRNDDECPDVFLGSQNFHVFRAETCCHNEYCKVGRRQFFHVVKGFYALYLVFFRVDDAQCTLILPVDKVAYNGASGLVHIVGTTDNHDAFGVKKLPVDHILIHFVAWKTAF